MCASDILCTAVADVLLSGRLVRLTVNVVLKAIGHYCRKDLLGKEGATLRILLARRLEVKTSQLRQHPAQSRFELWSICFHDKTLQANMGWLCFKSQFSNVFTVQYWEGRETRWSWYWNSNLTFWSMICIIKYWCVN